MNYRLLAAALAGAILLSVPGCGGAPPQVQEADSSPQYRVVAEGEQPSSPYLCEYPAIDAAVSLPGNPVVQTAVRAQTADEVRAVWISYLEMQTMLKNKTKKQFAANIGDAFDNVATYGLNTVIVQVRPFADALYDSDYFPWSHTITGSEGQNPGFDPLAVMVEQAKARGLRIEAWINPYRIRANGNTNALSSDNQARQWQAEKNGAVITYNGVTSFNPASEKARKLIVNGAVEIVRNYAVDGIHIDDYFYPSTDAAFDKSSYAAYQNGGGTLPLADWRRSNVEKLVASMYKAIKAENKQVLFGISPQSSVQNNYEAQYLDVEKIAGTDGYCDYICPQIYFGYDNAVQPYADTLQQWSDMVQGSSVKLYIGLGCYKIGATDSWAGSGKNEWLQNTDLMSRMVADARESSNYQGFVLYRYDSIFRPAAAVKSAVQKENKNLKKIL